MLLDLPIPRVMQRLRSAGAELESYENERFLERLQEAYHRVAGVLRKRRKMDVLTIDASELAADLVADRVETVCRRMIETARTASRAP